MLELNQKIKIVPNNIKNVSSGKIIAVESNEIQIEIIGKVPTTDEAVDCYVTASTCILFFKAEILKQEKGKIHLKYPQNIQKIQRREYTRVEVNLPIECTSADKVFSAETLNISGGGMKFRTIEEIQRLKMLNVMLPVGKNIKTDFELLNIQKDKNIFTASGWFKNINNADRIFLIQYCFKKELELKCIGLGG